jgi:hypothetical protein
MNRVCFLLLFYLLQFWGQSQSTLLHCKMVICSDLALPVAHYNQHRKLQDAAFSTEGPPVKEGACLHAVETVNSRLADTCSIVGSLVIFGYMWCAFLTFSYTLSLCVLVLFICVSVFESFPTGLVGQTSQVSRNSSKASKVTGPGCWNTILGRYTLDMEISWDFFKRNP